MNTVSNKEHPELQEGEVFIGNFYEAPFETEPTDYEGVGWKTKRKGMVAYGADSKPIQNVSGETYPVFVKKSELDSVDPSIAIRITTSLLA